MNNYKLKALKQLGLPAEEAHHIFKNRKKDRICNKCGRNIKIGEVYYGELTTLAYGGHLYNKVTESYHIECFKSVKNEKRKGA